jgi:serine/threonine protein kinase
MTILAHDLIGQIFAGYHIDVLIEHNGVTGIFVGQKEGPDRILKIALLEEARELLLHEETLLRKLRHPKIIQLIERIDVNGMPALVLFRYVRGSLTRYERRLSVLEITSIFMGLLEACAYLESKGVIHRDIKLENVVLDDSGSPVLIDFGVAHMKGEGRCFFVGSSEYAAPEVQKKPKEATGLSDLYSVGVLVHVLLYDRFPVVEDSQDWMEFSFTDSGLAVEQERLLARLLQPNKEFRLENKSDDENNKNPTVHAVEKKNRRVDIGWAGMIGFGFFLLCLCWVFLAVGFLL